MCDDWDEEPEAPECPYCEAQGWCEHQVLDLDETFGEVEDFGAFEESLDMLIEAIVGIVRSGRALPEELEENPLAGFMPFDPDERPEPSAKAVHEWLMDNGGWEAFREHYEDLIGEAGAEECEYCPPESGPGTTSCCRSYYAKDPGKVHAAVIEAMRRDLAPFGEAER